MGDEEPKVQIEQGSYPSSRAQINKIWTREQSKLKSFSTSYLLGNFVQVTALCVSVSSSMKWDDGYDNTLLKVLL